MGHPAREARPQHRQTERRRSIFRGRASLGHVKALTDVQRRLGSSRHVERRRLKGSAHARPDDGAREPQGLGVLSEHPHGGLVGRLGRRESRIHGRRRHSRTQPGIEARCARDPHRVIRRRRRRRHTGQLHGATRRGGRRPVMACRIQLMLHGPRDAALDAGGLGPRQHRQAHQAEHPRRSRHVVHDLAQGGLLAPVEIGEARRPWVARRDRDGQRLYHGLRMPRPPIARRLADGLTSFEEWTLPTVTYVLTHLAVGGAETQVVDLCGPDEAARMGPSVVSLIEPQGLTDRLDDEQIPWHSLGLRRGRWESSRVHPPPRDRATPGPRRPAQPHPAREPRRAGGARVRPGPSPDHQRTQRQ